MLLDPGAHREIARPDRAVRSVSLSRAVAERVDRRFSWILRALGLVATLAISACSAVLVRYPDGATAWQSRAEFAIYVEQVFRFHNRVVNDLIVTTSLLDGEELDANSPLVNSERTMAVACLDLNDTVSASYEGRETSFFRKLQLPATVPACEAATKSLEILLNEL